MTRVVRLLAVLLALVASCFAVDAPGADYKVLNTYVLGGEGGWDYLSIDASTHRLFISRGTHVMVVDTATGKPVGDVPNTPGIHGIAIVTDAGRAYTSNGRDNSATYFDLKTLETKGKVQTAEGPDAILYDPASKRVFTFNGRGKSATAIDAADAKVAGTIPLEGKPEFAVSDEKGHVYVNIEDKAEIAVIDSKKLAVTARWPLAPCEEPTGLALDAQHNRLFAGCHNKVMAIVNAENGKVVATAPIGQGVDATAFDPADQLAFASNWDGTLTVVHEDSPDKYTVVTNVPTALGARTMALDPSTHKIYLVTAEYVTGGTDRRATVPGSFKLLVVGKP